MGRNDLKVNLERRRTEVEMKKKKKKIGTVVWEFEALLIGQRMNVVN